MKKTIETLEDAQAYEGLLESHIGYLTDENKHAKGLLDCFWTGDVPDNATIDHLVLAKAGRQRLAERARRSALVFAKI